MKTKQNKNKKSKRFISFIFIIFITCDNSGCGDFHRRQYEYSKIK